MVRHIRQYLPFITASVLVCTVLITIYPYYQYYVDPDATAYLTIAKRYAAGEYMKAINGYWSPWGCWMAAIFIKAGLQPMLSAVVVNTVGGLCLMFIANSFFSYFKLESRLVWLLNAAFVVFMPYAVFWQLFDDIWQAFFLLCILRILVSGHFTSKPGLWILSGALGACAYFTKSYAFSFFILNIACCSFLISKQRHKGKKWLWLQISVVAIIAMTLCSMPWIYLLHMKYGKWLTSTAVNLNISWNLVGHPYWKAGITHLVPPVYPDAVSYWEDPYLVNGITPGLFGSFHLFVLQLVRFVYTFLVLAGCMNALSTFSIAIYLLAFGVLASGKLGSLFSERLQAVCLSLLLFPSGLLFIKAESRYIWYMLPLTMLVGGLALQRLFAYINNKWVAAIMAIVFAGSFAGYPVLALKEMFNEGKEQYQAARQLDALHIHGSFAANCTPGVQTRRIERLAYFSGNSFYNIPVNDFSHKELLNEMRRYKVNYYIYLCPQTDCDAYRFMDTTGQPLPEVTDGRINGMKIFKVN